MKRYKKVFNSIFKRYTGIGYKNKDPNPTFDKINQDLKLIHLPELLKMLKENHCLPELVSVSEATSLLRLVNVN